MGVDCFRIGTILWGVIVLSGEESGVWVPCDDVGELAKRGTLSVSVEVLNSAGASRFLRREPFIAVVKTRQVRRAGSREDIVRVGSTAYAVRRRNVSLML